MTKAHLIEKVAEKAKTLSRRDAEKVVNGIFDSIRGALKRGRENGDPRVWKFPVAHPAHQGWAQSQNRRNRVRA